MVTLAIALTGLLISASCGLAAALLGWPGIRNWTLRRASLASTNGDPIAKLQTMLASVAGVAAFASAAGYLLVEALSEVSAEDMWLVAIAVIVLVFPFIVGYPFVMYLKWREKTPVGRGRRRAML